MYAVVGLHPGVATGSYYSRVTGCTRNAPATHGFTAAMLPELYAEAAHQSWHVSHGISVMARLYGGDAARAVRRVGILVVAY